MKHKILKLAAVAAVTLPVLFSSALQADVMKFGKIDTSGVGCPSDSVTKSKNGKFTRLNFNGHFEATGDKYERETYCNIRIETFLPAGHYNAQVKVEFHGTHDLDYNGFARFLAEYSYGDNSIGDSEVTADGDSDPRDFVTASKFKSHIKNCNLSSTHRRIWLNVDSYLTAKNGRAQMHYAQAAMQISGTTHKCK